MAADLKGDLQDEIALEGLDGITINTLWIRLRDRPGFKLPLDDKCKSYLWQCVLGIDNLEFFTLSKPRANLITYDRFHYVDPESKHFLETEDIPDDIYPVNVLIDQPVQGSCAEYTTRKNITNEILADKPALDEVVKKYGNKLVIVASPAVRLRALIGPDKDPDCMIADVAYCLLERIGRARFCGEAASGKHSLTQIVDGSKTLFYQMKKIRHMSILKKQRMCTIRKPSNTKVTVCLFQLNRFFRPVVSKTQTDMMSLAKYLDSKKEKMEVVSRTKQALKVFDKCFKKCAQATDANGDRLFEFIDIPWRELHPNATPKEYLLKNGRAERTIRHIRLLKTVKEVEDRIDPVYSSDEEEEERAGDDVPKIPYIPEMDLPFLYQVLNIIRQAGSRGLSQVELQHMMGCAKLTARRNLKYLYRYNYVTTVLNNKGKVKEIMYVTVEQMKDNAILKNKSLEQEKLGEEFEEYHLGRSLRLEIFNRLNKEEEEKKEQERKSPKKPASHLSLEQPTEQKISQIKEELNKLEEVSITALKPPSQAKIEVMREMTEDGTLVNVKIEEQMMMGPEHLKSPDQLGFKRFGKLITEVHIRRINWIVEVVNAVRVLENFKLLRLLRNREKEMNLSYKMDQKSLKRLIAALVQEKKIRSFFASITLGDRVREFQYICNYSVTPTDLELMRAIDQAKLRYFSVSKEELRKKAKLLAHPPETTPKPPPKKDNGIPETAKKSIQKHHEWQKKMRMTTPSMKFNRKAGAKYGLLPKMLRIQATHQLLWYICYDTFGNKINSQIERPADSADTDADALDNLDNLDADLDSIAATEADVVIFMDNDNEEKASGTIKRKLASSPGKSDTSNGVKKQKVDTDVDKKGEREITEKEKDAEGRVKENKKENIVKKKTEKFAMVVEATEQEVETEKESSARDKEGAEADKAEDLKGKEEEIKKVKDTTEKGQETKKGGDAKEMEVDTEKDEDSVLLTLKDANNEEENMEINKDNANAEVVKMEVDDTKESDQIDAVENQADESVDDDDESPQKIKTEDETQKKVMYPISDQDKVLMGEPFSTSNLQWPKSEPYVYMEEMSWRRYLPPVPVHTGYPKGWCLMSDVLLNLPVCLFCQLVNVCYDIAGLAEILNHPVKRFYPVMKLPFLISQQLLHSKKYITSVFELCSYLCEMGLLSFGKEMLKDKDQTFIYLHRNASMLDTRDSLRGYNKTRKPPGQEDFPYKSYHFTCMSDINVYWEDLQIIATGSNLNYKSMVHADCDDNVEHTIKPIKVATKAYSPNTVEDDGIIPGDLRGAAGMDSGLFVHTVKNWTFSSLSRTSISEKPYNKLKPPIPGGDIVGKRKVVTHPNSIRGKERLYLSDSADKPAVQIKKITRENVKGNRGGRGVKKTHRVIRRGEGKLRHKRTIKLPTAPVPRKKPFEKGDDKDRAIYAKRTQQRVIWTSKEDSVLLMCWLGCLVMDKNRRVSIVNYRVMRDYLHNKVGEMSHDKTSIACARRLKFVLKNPQTEANLLLYYREANQDQFIKTEYMQKVFINTDKDIVDTFFSLTDLLLEKFQSLNLQRSALPANIEDLSRCRIDSINKLHSSKIYKDVTSREDICHDVLRTILHSAVLLQDKMGRTHEMFKLLTQYPDALLGSVIKELRSDGLFVIQKKQYAKVAEIQLHSGLGLRNFKVSQRYMYNYKHRNLSTLFEESADFLDELCDRYLQNDGEDQCETLDYQPRGAAAAIIIPLVLQGKLDIQLTLPQELVVVDMEGFYNFPWGRGKNVNQASTRADRTLQELKKKKQLTAGKSKGDTLGTPSKDASKGNDCGDLDDEEEEDFDVESGNTTLAKEKMDTVDMVGKASDSISKETQSDTTAAEEGKKGDTEKSITEDTGANVATGEADEKKADGPNITTCKKGFALVGKTIEEIKKNLSKEPDMGKKNSAEKLEYVCTKNGTSTFIVPNQEVTETGVVPEGASGFASRTLLSLRRAEDVSFEDIRVFNAQDNFVVNSCKIKVKLKDTGTGPVDKKAYVERKVCDNVEELIPFPEKTNDETQLPERKKEFIEGLRLGKKKMTELWNDLQHLLPFSLNMETVWSSLWTEGLTEDEVDQYKQVYHYIDDHGCLGVRVCDLHKHFMASVQWNPIAKVLEKYSALASKLRQWHKGIHQFSRRHFYAVMWQC